MIAFYITLSSLLAVAAGILLHQWASDFGRRRDGRTELPERRVSGGRDDH